MELLLPRWHALSCTDRQRTEGTKLPRQEPSSAEVLITVTGSLVPTTGSGVIDARGLPGYTFECASGELALPLRCDVQRDRGEQRPSRFRVRLAYPGAIS